MIMKKDIRRSLIDRYLNAEAEPEEERLLAEWFAVHGADEDEKEVARLILAEHPEAAFEAAEVEFESIVASHEKISKDALTKRARLVRWACAIAASAAVIAGIGLFLAQRGTCEFDGLEMAQGIERIMALDTENVESITARPKGNKVILTAVLNDGTKCSYVMSKDAGTSEITITAMR